MSFTLGDKTCIVGCSIQAPNMCTVGCSATLHSRVMMVLTDPFKIRGSYIRSSTLLINKILLLNIVPRSEGI